MKTLLSILFVLTFAQLKSHAGDSVPPEAEMVKLRKGYNFIMNGSVRIPNYAGGSSFVVQKGVLYAGMWGWRHGKFIVLRSLENAETDIALDRAAPSCQVTMEIAPSDLSGAQPFGLMMHAGYMHEGRATLYVSLSSNHKNQITCLAAEASVPGHTRFFARDLYEVWGEMITEIQSR